MTVIKQEKLDRNLNGKYLIHMKSTKDPIQLAKKLVSINSISGQEYEVSKYIFEYLKKIGLKPQLQKVADKRYNVFVKGSSNLLVSGHMDVVSIGDKKLWKYNPYGQLTKDKLYGRGSCDTKGNIACILSALVISPNKNVNVWFTVGEEDTFAGIKKLMKIRYSKFKNIKYCLELEPTDLKLVTTHKGRICATIETEGRSAHASVPQEGVNAILKMNEVITSLKIYTNQLKKRKHKIVGHDILNIGVIKGGISENIIPDYAMAGIDIRVIPGEKIKKVIKELTEVARPAKTIINNQYEPVELDNQSEIIKTFQNILKKHKLNPKPIGVSYTTQFSEMMKYDIGGFIFGVGGIDQAHKIDEHIKLKDLKNCHKILVDLLSNI